MDSQKTDRLLIFNFALAADAHHNASMMSANHGATDAHHWLAALVSGLLALAVFSVTLGGTYIYDDQFIVASDPRISHPSQWGQFWTQAYFPEGADNLYRPLTSLSYGVQWWLHGDLPWAFHLVNLLLYGACAAAVAELARRLGGTGVAYVAGLLFAVHPIHTEAVAAIVGRADLLCTLFFVTALILLAHRPLTMKRVWLIFILCVLSLLSKEPGLLLPPALLLFAVCRQIMPQHCGDALPDPSPAMAKKRNSPAMVLTLLMCWFWAGYLVFREWLLPMEWDRGFLDWTLNPMIRAQGWNRVLVPVELLGRYTQLLMVPWRLSFDYSGRVIGSIAHPTNPYLYLGMATALIWAVLAAWALLRRHGIALFCLLMMALSWGMVSNLGVLIGTIFGERLMFLLSVFFVIFIAMGLTRLPRRIAGPILAVLLILGIARSYTYARHWNNRLQFYAYSFRQQPMSSQINLVLADELIVNGEFDRADRVLEIARRQYPDYWAVWSTSFDLAIRQRRLAAARQYMEKAVHLVPNPTYLWSRREALATLEKEMAAATTAPTSSESPDGSSDGGDAAH